MDAARLGQAHYHPHAHPTHITSQILQPHGSIGLYLSQKCTNTAGTGELPNAQIDRQKLNRMVTQTVKRTSTPTPDHGAPIRQMRHESTGPPGHRRVSYQSPSSPASYAPTSPPVNGGEAQSE